LVEKYHSALDVRNKNDENCLISSVRGNHLEVVEFICTQSIIHEEYPLDLDYECKINGLSAFAIACLKEHFKVATILLTYGADKNFRS
jgi:ankyrin repeat protein